jgi:hypothetical protein
MVLQKRGRLVTLVLDRNKLGDRGATAIATGLSLNYTLSTLGLSQNQASLPSRSDRDTPVVAAPTLANIEFFRPRRVQISEDGAAAFAQCLIDNSTLVRSLCRRHSSLQRSVHGGVAARLRDAVRVAAQLALPVARRMSCVGCAGVARPVMESANARALVPCTARRHIAHQTP